MEDTSQPLSDAVPSGAENTPDTPPKASRRPRKSAADKPAAKGRTPRAAKTNPEPAAEAAPVAEPAAVTEARPPAVRPKAKSPAVRSGSRPPAVKNKAGLPVVKEEQPVALNAPEDVSAARERPAPAARKNSSPAGNDSLAAASGAEAVAAPAQQDRADSPAENAPAEGAPSKRRRRRGGRGRKRPAAEASRPENQAIPMPAAETPGQPASEVAALAQADQADAPDAGQEAGHEAGQAAPREATGSRSRSRGRSSRSRSKKQQASQPPRGSAESPEAGADEDSPRQTPLRNEPGLESLPLTAETPVLLLDAGAPLTEELAVVNLQETRSSRRGGRGRGARPAVAAAEQVQAAPAEQPRPETKGRKLLVSVLPDDQVEVVVIESGKVREYYIEMTHQAKIRGNIYKGVVSNIDTNLQAAFVNYGAAKNGFLQIDEVHPEYYLNTVSTGKGHKYPPIQKVMKAGQEVLVQVGKEPTGNKGAFLTTWISLAGRFLVLTPGQPQIGISRKVEDGEERNRLRELIKGINPGEGLGAIVRTVSAGATKTTIQKDLNYLKRLWRDIRKKGMQEKAPALVYAEPGLAARSMRDYLTDDVVEVWVDDEATAASMREMIALLFPRKSDVVKLHTDTRRTLFERFDVLDQIEQIHSREVILPSGGRLVFDQTEALMAIDINSGKTGGGNSKTSFESMAFRTNMEAAEVIPQQLRLRDIGGQVVIDFIEMRDQSQVRDVEKTLRNSMKADRARHDVGKMSAFGLLQIVRQRTGSSAISISMEPCPFCQGTGTRRNMEWQALQVLRDLHRKLRDAHDSGQTGLVYTVDTELAWYLLNHKRERLTTLEQDLGVKLEIRPARNV